MSANFELQDSPPKESMLNPRHRWSRDPSPTPSLSSSNYSNHHHALNVLDDEEEMVLQRAKAQHSMYLRQQELEAEQKRKLLDAMKAAAAAATATATATATSAATSAAPSIYPAQRIDHVPSRTMNTTPIRNRRAAVNGEWDSHTSSCNSSSGTNVSPPPTSIASTALELPPRSSMMSPSPMRTQSPGSSLRPKDKLNEVFWSDVSSEHTSSGHPSRAVTPNETDQHERDIDKNDEENDSDNNGESKNPSSAPDPNNHRIIDNDNDDDDVDEDNDDDNDNDNDDNETPSTTCTTSNVPDIYIPPPLPLLSQSSLPMRAQRALTGILGRPESLRHFRHLNNAPKEYEPCLTPKTSKTYGHLFPNINGEEPKSDGKRRTTSSSSSTSTADVPFYLDEHATLYARPDALREIDFWLERMECVGPKIPDRSGSKNNKKKTSGATASAENSGNDDEGSSCGAAAARCASKTKGSIKKSTKTFSDSTFSGTIAEDANETPRLQKKKKMKKRYLLIRPSTLKLREKRNEIKGTNIDSSDGKQISGERSGERSDDNTTRIKTKQCMNPKLKVDIVPSCTPSRHYDRTKIMNMKRVKFKNVLKFDSQFECGNLLWSKLIGQRKCKNGTILQEYDLTLQHDLFTNGNVQWFYYRVGNTKKNMTVRFNLINMKKSGSLFGDGGMQPCVYSQIDARERNIGWIRSGTDVIYYNNSTSARLSTNDYQRKQSTLSFIYTFQHDSDCVFFAMCHPYTYTDMQEDIAAIRNDPQRSKHVVFQSLCSTIAENRVDLLTITGRAAAPSSLSAFSAVEKMRMNNTSKKRSKRAIVLSSRVHPGETNASWMMRGVLDFLTSDTKEAKGLREMFVFKVIPMLNPDGVINGNYRCNLSGRDLNRKWANPSKWEQPSIFGMRHLFEKMNRDDREIALFCDMHGHSRKKNIFVYGCLKKKKCTDRDPRPLEFPYMLSTLSHPFSFMDSRFKVQRSKYGTGRVVGWRGFGITLSFTMEASFCGPSVGPHSETQFRTIDLERMGREFCTTLYAHFKIPQWQADKMKSNEEGQPLSPISSVKKTIAERAMAAQDQLLLQKQQQEMKLQAGSTSTSNYPTSENDNGSENENENDTEDNLTEDSEDYVETEDEDEGDVSVLAAALASTMTLQQIEDIYEGGSTVTVLHNSNTTSGGNSVNDKSSKQQRRREMDSGGSDSDASGDNLDDDELRTMLYSSLKPKFMMKSMSDGGLLSTSSSSKKKKKKKKKGWSGDAHNYLKRKSKSIKEGGKMDLKGGVGRVSFQLFVVLFVCCCVLFVCCFYRS